MWNSMVFYDFVNFGRFQFKLGFFTYFEYPVVSSKKTLYVQITIVTDDIDAKKPRKTFHKLYIKYFLNAYCEFFIYVPKLL